MLHPACNNMKIVKYGKPVCSLIIFVDRLQFSLRKRVAFSALNKPQKSQTVSKLIQLPINRPDKKRASDKIRPPQLLFRTVLFDIHSCLIQIRQHSVVILALYNLLKFCKLLLY